MCVMRMVTVMLTYLDISAGTLASVDYTVILGMFILPIIFEVMSSLICNNVTQCKIESKGEHRDIFSSDSTLCF